MPNTIATFTYDVGEFAGENPATPETRAVFDAYEAEGKILSFERTKIDTVETMSIMFRDSECMENYLVDINQNTILQAVVGEVDATYKKADEEDINYFNNI